MAGVLRAPGFDAAVGVLTWAEWNIINRIAVLDQCVAAEEQPPLTMFSAGDRFFMVLNNRIRIDAEFLTAHEVTARGFAADSRGDPDGLAFECGDEQNPGWCLFNCELHLPSIIGG